MLSPLQTIEASPLPTDPVAVLQTSLYKAFIGRPLEPPLQNTLAGKRAVVTGSSSGIGRSVAELLAAEGAEVVVHGWKKRQAAEGLVDSIRSRGGHAECVFSDLAQEDGPDQLVQFAWEKGPVDIWVNNAGVDVLTGPAADWSFEEKLAALWQVDVAASIRLSRAVGQRMKQRGSGSIVNMGWDQAETGMEGDSGEMFAACKGAVMAFSRSLAKSLAPEVRVNCVAPGWIKTDWGEDASEYWQKRAVEESLLERWGTPEDVAGAVLFLVSPKSSFITGHVIPINGGRRSDSASESNPRSDWGE